MYRRTLPMALVVLATMMVASVPVTAATHFAPAPASAAPLITQQNLPKILRIASQDDVKGLNILAVNDVWSSNVLSYIYDATISRDWKTEQYQPWLAVEWCTESKSNPPACSKDDADENVQNITVRYKVGDWSTKYGTPMKWHDGGEVTLDDVLFSYMMYPYWGVASSTVKDLVWTKAAGFDWQTPPFGDSSFQQITSNGDEAWLAVKKADAHTLQFRLKQPYADFFIDTLGVTLFPKHIWSKHIDQKAGTGDFLQWDMDYNAATGQAPGLIGSSAFKFNKWVKTQFAKSDVNTAYHDWTKLPKVDARGRIVYPGEECTVTNARACAYDPAWTRMHPNAYIEGLEYGIYLDTNAAALALQQAKVDLVAWAIPPSMVEDMRSGDKCTDLSGNKVNCGSVVGLEKTSERGFFYTAFNMRRQPFGYKDFPNGDFTDLGKPFRKSVAYSTDKSTIVSQVLQGYGKAALGPVSPDLRLWHNDSLPAYPLDETKANALLDAQGWTRDPSCPKVGNPPDFARKLPVIACSQIDMLTPEAAYDPVRAVAGQMIEAQSQKIGLNLKSIPTAFGKIVTQIGARDFQMYILGWRIGSDPGGYMRSFFHCTEEKSGNNYPGYCNPAFDKLMDEFDQTFNQSRRVQIIKDQQGMLVEDLPYNVLYFRDSVEAFRKDRFVVSVISPPSWIKGVTGIFNGWSLQLVDSPVTPTTLTHNAPSDMKGGTTQSFSVTYLTGGTPIDSANVKVTTQAPLSFPGGGTSIDLVTDSTGVAKITVTAGPVAADTPTVVSIQAAKSGYQDGVVQATIVVTLKDRPGVLIQEVTASPAAFPVGSSTTVTVVVLDKILKTPLKDATVKLLALEPADLATVDAAEKKTADNGQATFAISVDKAKSVSAATDLVFRANASATIDGIAYYDEEAGKVTVNPATKAGTTVPGFEGIALIAAVVAAGAVFSVVLARKRRA